MSLEDRIRSEGKAAINAFAPAPDLDDRIITHMRRRIRRRRQRAAVGLGVGVVAITIALVALVNRPANQTFRVVSPTDPTEASSSLPASNPTASPSTVPQPVASEPTSFFGVDPATMTGAEYGLDGAVLRRFGVARPPAEPLLTPGGDEIVLGATPGEHSIVDDEPCQNRPVTIKGQPLHPDLAMARVADVANGVLYAARSVCPNGTRWGAVGTGWELIKLDLRNAGTGQVEVLHFFRADKSEQPSGVWRDSLMEAPHQLKVTPDGRWVMVGGNGSTPPAQDVWAAIPTATPAKPLVAMHFGCGLDLAYLGDAGFVFACAEGLGMPYAVGVLADGAVDDQLTSTTVKVTSSSQAHISVRASASNPTKPYVLLTSMEATSTLGAALIRDGTATSLDSITGLAAWSLAELGYVETGPVPTAPTTSSVPSGPSQDPGPGPATITVRYDSELQGVPSNPVADLGISVPATDGTSTYPRFRFSDFGTGTMVAVDPATGVVVRANVDGRSHRNMIPVDDRDGPVVDVALGPEDRSPSSGLDPTLYVSRSNTDADGNQHFTLVAYGLSNDAGSELANELGRWSTDWACSERGCGGITFTGRGIDVGGQIVNAGRPVFAALPQPSRNPVAPSAHAGDSCIDDRGDGFFGAFRDEMALGRTTWTVEVQCASVAEGEFSAWSAQPDGSVLVFFRVHHMSSDTARDVVVRLAPDGSAVAYEVVGSIYQFAWINGRLYGISTVPGGTAQLVELAIAP